MLCSRSAKRDYDSVIYSRHNFPRFQFSVRSAPYCAFTSFLSWFLSLSLPGHFASYIPFLRRIVAFCNFPYVSTSRISRHAECARASTIFAMRHTSRRYRDEADEATHAARKFFPTWREKSYRSEPWYTKMGIISNTNSRFIIIDYTFEQTLFLSY